jgi:hypothetical protein
MPQPSKYCQKVSCKKDINTSCIIEVIATL